jgi:TatD DNase family protein
MKDKIKNKLVKAPAPIFETHCHFDYLKSDTVEEIYNTSIEQNVTKFLTVAVEPDNQDLVVEIANKYEHIYCSQGVHPHHAKDFDNNCVEKILNNCKNQKVVTIGEIGLDYHYNHSEPKTQQEVFENQIQIALDQKMPIIVHTREAEDDTKSILKNFPNIDNSKVLIHCFTASIDFAKFAIANGYKIGFNGIITFPKANNVREVLQITPVEQILLETDAPFLAPKPFRGKENAPYMLPFISQEIAKLKGIEEKELLQIIYSSSCNFFGIN